jgi:hypothetical protein
MSETIEPGRCGCYIRSGQALCCKVRERERPEPGAPVKYSQITSYLPLQSGEPLVIKLFFFEMIPDVVIIRLIDHRVN